MGEYGLIGKSLAHSFSKTYFENKFKKQAITDSVYLNFELKDINDLTDLIKSHPNLKGFNVTIPYKETIIPFMDELSDEAKAIGAVNCVKIDHGKLIGFNTDVFGFASSIKPFLEPHHNRALILGTGGSSKAVAYALKKIGVEVFYASSTKQELNCFLYENINEHMLRAIKLIVNTTPLGMYPMVDECPDIPYSFIDSSHLCYDLIYNPEETLFLKKCRLQGATIMNGLSMLHLQAEKSWDIWQSGN